VDVEATIFKREAVHDLRHNKRKEPCRFWIFGIVIAINKDVFIPTMAMQIAIQNYLPFFLELFA
jgi:hypothetical protein